MARTNLTVADAVDVALAVVAVVAFAVAFAVAVAVALDTAQHEPATIAATEPGCLPSSGAGTSGAPPP